MSTKNCYLECTSIMPLFLTPLNSLTQLLRQVSLSGKFVLFPFRKIQYNFTKTESTRYIHLLNMSLEFVLIIPYPSGHY